MMILAIIPCFNEAENVGELLDSIADQKLSIETLVIDDASTDETFSVASKKSKCVRVIKNLGIGGAVQTGFVYAYRNKYSCALQIDGDGQHPPDQITKLISAWHETGADLVIGSRFLEEESFRSTLTRRLGISLITLTLKIFYGQKFTDPTSGFRLYGPRALELFQKEYFWDFPEPLAICSALNKNLKVVETSVQMTTRKHGVSSISGFKNLTYMARVIGYIFLNRVSRYLL